MGNIIINLDYGRRAEYFTALVLSQYALIVPIKGHDDRVESDFLCIGLEKEDKYYTPKLNLIFWVQSKSQSQVRHKTVIIDTKSKVDSLLGNSMPYFISVAHNTTIPSVSLYDTSERIAFKHKYPYVHVNSIHFILGTNNSNPKYEYISSESRAVISMGKPFLKIFLKDCYERDENKWHILRRNIERNYRNFIYASSNLGTYERDLSLWGGTESISKIFYPENGVLTDATNKSILIALQMLKLTQIERARCKDPNSELVRAFDLLFKAISKAE